MQTQTKYEQENHLSLQHFQKVGETCGLSILNKPEVAVKWFQAAAAGGSHKTESHSNFQVVLVSGFMGKTLSANKKSNKQATRRRRRAHAMTPWRRIKHTSKWQVPDSVPAQLLMATVVRHHVQTTAGLLNDGIHK